jgi:hypothetical protein
MESELLGTLARQDGVVSRSQAIAAGLAQHDIRRLLRRREWARVHSGVYVDHTGALTWNQRAWAAVLFSWPSALYGESALRAARGPGMRAHDDSGPIHVAVERSRGRLVEPPGVRVHHLVRLGPRVQWNLGPPRMRFDEAALELAGLASSDFEAIARLADACQSRRTTAARMRVALRARPRSGRRGLLDATLADVAAGTCSVLEHGYVTRVERPHGLPAGSRQVRADSSAGVIYRDVDYDPVILELDGRLFHDTATQRDRDFERDLDAAVDGRATVRLSYGQVFERPCSTAGKVARVLARHGVAVEPRPCGPACQVDLGRVA